MDLRDLDWNACFQNREPKTNFFVFFLTFETKCIAKLADYPDPESTSVKTVEKTEKTKD